MTRRVVALAVVVALTAAACASSNSVGLYPTTTTLGEAVGPETTVAPASTSTAPGSAPTVTTGPATHPATITPTPCPTGLASPAAECALADVALDPADPSGATIQVSLVTVAGSNGGFATPVAIMQGGPGGASSDMAVWFPQREFTQVFVDQRGTGFASSDFDCSEADGLSGDTLGLSSREASLVVEEAYASCAARLAGSQLLAYTNSAAHAADVEAVMAGLGHDRWIAYGVSYGTTIALQMMRDPAEGLVGAVLDGVYPPDLDVDDGLAFSANRSIQAVDSACRDDASCRGIVDGVADTLDRLILELDTDPLIVSPGGDFPDTTLDGQRLAEFTFLMLYGEREVARIPWVLDGLDRGDEVVAQWLVRVGSIIQDRSSAANDEGTYFAVQCHDRVPFTDGAAAGLGPFASAITVVSTDEICEPWSVGTAERSQGLAVESDIPTLLLSGGFDPITPADYAAAVAGHLSHSTVVEQDGRGHGIWFGNACIGDIVLSFVSDPTGVVDTSCSSDAVPVDWVKP